MRRPSSPESAPTAERVAGGAPRVHGRPFRLQTLGGRQAGATLVAAFTLLLMADGRAVAAPAAADGDLPWRAVADSRLVVPGGGRLDWSRQGDLIAFDRADREGGRDLWVTTPEGSGERCLTCLLVELRRIDKVDPAWHPSGDWLAFRVQRNAAALGLDPLARLSPARALRSELWVVDRRGRNTFQLSRFGEGAGAVADPAFSNEGDRLLWSERISGKGGEWGEWTLRAAAIGFRADLPRLRKVETLAVGVAALILTPAYAPDDRDVFFAGSPEPNSSGAGLDIYRYDAASKAAERLTSTPRLHDERPLPAPQDDRLGWISELPAAAPQAGVPAREVFVMRPDGSRPERLTGFNQPGAVEHLGRSAVGDFAWGPDGERLAAHVVSGPPEAPQEGIYLLTLAVVHSRDSAAGVEGTAP